jgi:sec-independent protein translocase protein TatB
MIDLGLTKLALIGAVALVVLGPEKLPKVARMAGTLFGRAQRYMREVKDEVSREIELDELRKMKQEMQDAASEAEQSIAGNLADIESGFSGGSDADQDYGNLLQEPPSQELIANKARAFRKKRLSHVSGLPSWYKHQTGRRSRVISAAARVAKFRPAGSRKSFPGFY